MIRDLHEKKVRRMIIPTIQRSNYLTFADLDLTCKGRVSSWPKTLILYSLNLVQRNIKFTIFAVENVSGPHKLLLLSCVTLRNYRNSIFMIIQCIGVHIRYNTKHMTWSQRLFIDQEKWTTLLWQTPVRVLCGNVDSIHCFVFWTAQIGKFCHYWFFKMHKGFALKYCSASHPNKLVFFIISRYKIQIRSLCMSKSQNFPV